ncbi:hypothetical protein FACS189491_10640 [Spirochaetia bacterium]|nr:hypothetical protein FACS189491_10640 [Spirochaetia bacterium]
MGFINRVEINEIMLYIYNMKKGFFILALGMVFFSFPLPAQNTKPLIQLTPLFSQGIGDEESRFIESLVQSYLSDFGEVISAAGSDPAVPESDTRIPDYTFTGSIYLERDSLILMLEIGKAAAESASFTMVSKSIGELALKARSLVEIAFSSEPERAGLRASAPLDLKEAAVLGTWRGEPGIEMIRFQRMGRGIAVFSSGASMVLSWAVEDNILRARQISPNTERYYHPLPYEVAKQLTAQAEPMVWELRLYDNGNTLRGIKTLTGIRYEGTSVTELIPKEMQNVEWIRQSSQSQR